MKILTATAQTQGWRDNDFCGAVEGELVFFPPIECDCEAVDGKCGCRRAMAGSVSHRATTTMRVVERKDLTPQTYKTLITDGLISQGYVTEGSKAEPEVKEWIDDFVDSLIGVATAYPDGAVLERRGNFTRQRIVRPDPGTG